ncbi:hypothetical protein IVB45_18490 [Bradyrhizobium sp. 4]|uniref:hypothetical protein n=1 Tax=unclassified Bradyrhizobium TaxID=2631580 RepID=UPI001FF75BA4|nr:MULTISPECIES: hypothetical protein [unclassified Bradyrhizobium]MCK1400111.1 hypothetical protein [Bradyrhizobium sp. 39]MCK1750401.1 hypothetical protein [Bradyrhizobium sp. 135]UPJ32010.1 hypothetical protein IVB45_18490 [Bradyrhizobium sp. 4]
MEADARADAPVSSESTELTVASAAEVLSSELHDDGPAERRTPAIVEKEVDPPAPSDDTKIKLKDGAELSLTELKRGYISRKTFTAKTQALAEERARFEEVRVHIQHHAGLVAELRQALDVVAAALLPQQPDASLVDVDPQQWKDQQAEYEFKMGVIAHAQQAARNEVEAAQTARDAEGRDFAHRQVMARQQQQEKLLETMPELTNAKEARRFQEDAIDTMAEYGCSVEELNAMLNDWRNFRIVRDLSRYQKAMKSVSKVKGKIAGAPVLTSNRRMDRAARSTRATRTEFEQFANTGRLDDAAAIIAQRMKD